MIPRYNHLNLKHLVVIHVSLLLLIFFLVPLPLSPDEAHYYLWSQKLDWSYYSKGPLLALVIRASTALFGRTEYAVRLPALAFSIGSLLLIYQFLKHRLSKFDSFLIYLAIFSSVSMWYQALVMTTDAPVVFFWILACLSLLNYFERAPNSMLFLFLGILSIGLGLWTKYTILVVPLVFSFLFYREIKAKRVSLSHFFGFVLGIALFFVPVIFWNYQNDWVNLAHNATHVGFNKDRNFTLKYLLDFIGGQIGIFGFLLPVILKLAFNAFKSKPKNLDFDSTARATALLLILICLLVSLFKRIYPNWTMPAYPLLMLLLATPLIEFYRNYPKSFTVIMGLNFIVTIMGVGIMQGETFALPGKLLPTKKLVGWDDYSAAIRKAAFSYSPDIAIMTESYDFASELGFYSPDLKVVNVALPSRRMNQFDIWQKRENALSKLKGQDVLLVLSRPEEVSGFKTYFRSIEIVTPSPYYVKDYAGSKMRDTYLYLGRGYSGETFSKLTRR